MWQIGCVCMEKRDTIHLGIEVYTYRHDLSVIM